MRSLSAAAQRRSPYQAEQASWLSPREAPKVLASAAAHQAAEVRSPVLNSGLSRARWLGLLLGLGTSGDGNQQTMRSAAAADLAARDLADPWRGADRVRRGRATTDRRWTLRRQPERRPASSKMMFQCAAIASMLTLKGAFWMSHGQLTGVFKILYNHKELCWIASASSIGD